MDDIKKELNNAYKLLGTLTVSGDAVDILRLFGHVSGASIRGWISRRRNKRGAGASFHDICRRHQEIQADAI